MGRSDIQQGIETVTNIIETLRGWQSFGSNRGFKLNALQGLSIPGLDSFGKLTQTGTYSSNVQDILKGLYRLREGVSKGGEVGEAASLLFGLNQQGIHRGFSLNEGGDDVLNAISELSGLANGALKNLVDGKGSATPNAINNARGGLTTPMPTPREAASAHVSINGKILSSTYDEKIEKIIIHERHEHAMSSCEVHFNNDEFQYTDEQLWGEHLPIRVVGGYSTTGMRNLGGTFYSMGPTYYYPGLADENPRIILKGVSEEFLLGRTEERVVWQNLRDDQIASQIAEKHGLLAAVQDTGEQFEQVAQVNESDWKFLDRRARLYGYQLFVENSILHFHQPFFRESGIRLHYNIGEESQVGQLIVEGNPYQRGVDVQMTQINPTTKEWFDLVSSRENDDISRMTMAAFQNDENNSLIDRWDNMTQFGGNVPRRFMMETGHRQTAPLLQPQLNGTSQSTRWLVTAEADVIGVEWFRARDVIEIVGCGRNSGKYYVTDVIHQFEGTTYTCKLMLTRTWTGSSTFTYGGKSESVLVEVNE